MLSFADLTARDLVWQGDSGITIPMSGDFHFVLHAGQEQAATAHMTWHRMQFFDVTMESADGVYQVHMDLSRNERPTVVWRPGDDKSVLAMTITWELVITCGGNIDTQSGRRLLIEPTHQMGYEYAIFPQGGARILTLAAPMRSIPMLSEGGNPGPMSIEAASASDTELPALVALAFTVASEEVRLLHKAAY